MSDRPSNLPLLLGLLVAVLVHAVALPLIRCRERA